MTRVTIPILTREGSMGNADLMNQLYVAVEKLAVKMRATVPIRRDGHIIGFGVGEDQRVIAADRVISIAKVIKALKGW